MYANNIVVKAKSFIGVKEDPQNSNDVIFNRNYYGKNVRGAAYPWCVVFIWDIFRLCGASELFFRGKKTAYCPTVEDWGRKDGLIVGKNDGDAGDIILFDFNNKGIATHVGIIEKKISNGSYTTIEGNTGLGNDENGGAVMRRSRKQSVIRCIIRPQYQQNAINNLENVAEVQKYLNEKIKASLDIDGDYGALTKKALIMYWQFVIGNGLSIDGSFGPKSQEEASRNNIKRGYKGEVVRIMQMGLICIGYSLSPYGADGSFGPVTEREVKELQRANKILEDGICGRNTWSVIFK